MSISANQPKQLRAEKTRQKLIDATIECLAKYGYAGTELGLVCDVAKVARRSRQYYFPDRISLMLAVWHEIRCRDDAAFDGLHKPSQPLDVTVELILKSAFKKYKTDQYLADMELKLAIRSDEELAMHLSPLMKEREREADKLWVTLFKELGKPRQEIITIRYLHISLLRGLEVGYLSGIGNAHLKRLEEKFKTILHSQLV